MTVRFIGRALTAPAVSILLALVAGVTCGAILQQHAPPRADQVAGLAGFIGGVWIDALRMTIVPLIFSLVVTGLNTTIGLGGGVMGTRALALFLGLLSLAAAFATLVVPPVLSALPPPPIPIETIDAGTALPAADAVASTVAVLRGLVPANPIRAAADAAMAPLLVFALIFGFAVQRIEASHRELLLQVFEAIAQVMLAIVKAVLRLSPIGVFGLAVAVGMKAGFAIAGSLAHYVALACGVCLAVTALIYLPAALWVRRPFGLYARALAPAQLIAFSTQSSLAATPAVLLGAEKLGLRPEVVKVLPPLAVTVFRVTAPAANVAGALYMAAVLGVSVHPAQIAAAGAIAVVSSLSSVGLPVQISFIAMLAPICAAMGIPPHLLPLLLAVEPLVDTCRTLGNVTGQFAATCLLGADPRDR